MRKLLFLLLFGVLALIGVGGVCSSCDHQLKKYRSDSYLDSVEFSHMLVKSLPAAQQQVYKFDDVVDVITYKLERQRQHKVDSIFMTLSDQQIANISSVLFKRGRSISVKDIVYEYQAYKHVYDGLPEEHIRNDTPQKDEITIDAGSINLTPDSV